MKKLLQLILMLLISNLGYSQIYYSHYLDQTSEWRVIEHHALAADNDIAYRTIFFDGLENLNGYTYYKMYQTYYKIGYEFDYSSVIYPQSTNSTQFIGYFREDPNGKFYLFNNSANPIFFIGQFFNNNVETVFFDNQTVLDAQIGDLYFGNFCSVDAINSLNITGVNCKEIINLWAGVATAGQVIEGVGNIFYSCDAPQNADSSLATFTRIHCYTKQGQTYSFYDDYHLPNFVLIDCNSFPNANRQGLSTVTYENNSIKVFPNPAKTVVTVASNEENIKEILLCDMQGRLLKTVEVNKLNTQLDISSYQSGTYLITIKTDRGISNSKLIKE